jgi:hypothetical protein
MAPDFDIHIGTRDLWGGGQQPFGLTDRDAFQHVWLNGQTGVGKSALMRSMFIQAVHNNHGCTLIDPNGDLANEILDYIPLSRRDDVVFIDPSRAEHVLPINPFYNIPIDKRPLLAQDFTEACRDIWLDSWGERCDWILSNTVAAVLDAPVSLRPTLLSIPLVLADKHYRAKILAHVKNPNVRRFFETEFLRWPESKRSDYIMPVENKIGKIIANPFVANLLSPYQPAFQLKYAITRRSILIVRLSKGAIGANPTNLLGSLAISAILNAAMAQEAIPYEDRIPHFLFIDETHNLKTTALTTAFSEHRKYKLSIVASSQYTDQIDDDVLTSMFGNIGTIVAFRSSATDADRFEKHIGEFPAHHYTQLGTGEVRVRLLQGGAPVVPFRAVTTIDHHPPVNKATQILTYNRERYTKPRAQVEQDYIGWLRKALFSPTAMKQHKKKVVAPPKSKPTSAPRPPASDQPAVISARGDVARANIRAILEAKKPTRRKLRR